MNQYSFVTSIVKAIRHAAVFGLSLGAAYFVAHYPQLASESVLTAIGQALQPLVGGLTVGAVVTLVINWLQNKDLGTAGFAPKKW